MAVRIEPLTGAAVAEALPALARLRIEVFRAYPYLYDGSLAYEEEYISSFARSEGTLIVAARDGERIVGAATASPLAGHADQFAEPLRAKGYDVGRIFYCGESVLLPAYRGQGIGKAFFDHREAHARGLGGYDHITFCAVVRPAGHPLKPKDYVPLDAFWRKRGYAPVEGLIGSFSWKDIDKAEADDKPMQFWMRAL